MKKLFYFLSTIILCSTATLTFANAVSGLGSGMSLLMAAMLTRYFNLLLLAEVILKYVLPTIMIGCAIDFSVLNLWLKKDICWHVVYQNIISAIATAPVIIAMYLFFGFGPFRSGIVVTYATMAVGAIIADVVVMHVYYKRKLPKKLNKNDFVNYV